MPNVLSPRDLVFRPDNMDETVPHIEELSSLLSSHLKWANKFNMSARGQTFLLE